MAAGHERAPECDRRKGVAGVAECREQEPPRRDPVRRALGQTISARSRIIRLRASGSKAIGVHMSEPTPASL